MNAGPSSELLSGFFESMQRVSKNAPKHQLLFQWVTGHDRGRRGIFFGRCFELNGVPEEMPLSAEEIASHPAALRGVKEQSRALIHIYETSPRLAAVFATQQRWLLG
ncbi:MAG: hypothetical protein E5X11_27020, partial [Mesorhizobium sp.]